LQFVCSFIEILFSLYKLVVSPQAIGSRSLVPQHVAFIYGESAELPNLAS